MVSLLKVILCFLIAINTINGNGLRSLLFGERLNVVAKSNDASPPFDTSKRSYLHPPSGLTGPYGQSHNSSPTDNNNGARPSNPSDDHSDNNESGPSSIIPTPVRKLRSFGFGITSGILRAFLGTVIVDPDVLRVATKTISIVIWGFIALSALGTFGVDVKPMLSLVSVLGVTLGLAAKDILTNTFAGLLIIFTSPFKRGWIISIEGQRGKVLGIDTRYVRLQSLKDKSEILVPLSLVYKSSIIVERRDDD